MCIEIQIKVYIFKGESNLSLIYVTEKNFCRFY